MAMLEEAQIFRALGDENRLKILDLLGHGEKCACVLLDALDITQPTLSHHMKILCETGLVSSNKVGRWMHYSLQSDALLQAAKLLEGFTQSKDCIVPDAITPVCEKTKLFLFTGFLGCGKTTLLTKLLDTLPDSRIGVIQNEFGKLGIDGTILGRESVEMVEINRGSIFCSCLKLSFVQALGDMAKKNFDYLFVESSGLGDPSNMEEILSAVQVLAGDRYQFGGAICLVDGAHFMDQLDDLETVYRQLKHCHLAVITKVDLISPEQLDIVRQKVRELNPQCLLRISSNGNLSPQFLNEDLLQYTWAESEETTNSVETKPKTISLQCAQAVAQADLEAFLNRIMDLVYRVKGFFLLKEGGWHQIDLVGRKIDIKPCEPEEISQLVLISRVGPALIKPVFAAWEVCVDAKMELKN